MNTAQVVDIMTKALIVALKLAGPFLMVALGVGVIVGLFQSITQLQEPTLSFVPKLLGSGLVAVVGGTWMIGVIVDFAHQLISNAPNLGK